MIWNRWHLYRSGMTERQNGMKQAQELIDGMSGLFAGGTLSEQDKDAVMKALQDIYWESKARNVEKYTPKKYKKQKTEE